MNIAHLVIPLLLPGFHAYPWQTARKPPGQPNESAVGESKRVLPGFQLPGVSCLGKGTQHMVLFGEAESKHRPESLQGGVLSLFQGPASTMSAQTIIMMLDYYPMPNASQGGPKRTPSGRTPRRKPSHRQE